MFGGTLRSPGLHRILVALHISLFLSARNGWNEHCCEGYLRTVHEGCRHLPAPGWFPGWHGPAAWLDPPLLSSEPPGARNGVHNWLSDLASRGWHQCFTRWQAAGEKLHGTGMALGRVTCVFAARLSDSASRAKKCPGTSLACSGRKGLGARDRMFHPVERSRGYCSTLD